MRNRYLLPNYRIAVVGAGAIGCYYGAKLAHYGRDVHFLMRGDLTETRRFGIQIRSKGENLRLAKVNHYASTEEIGPCDLVLVALKATSNSDLTTLIPPLLHEKTMLLSLQNGFGNEEFLAEHFGAERVLGGLCFICLNRVSRGVIEHYGEGRLSIGEYSGGPKPRTHDVIWEFKRCGVVGSVVENLALERWRKLVWNIPFNGLSVTSGGIDTAAILADEHLHARTLALMEEVIAAANRCGFPLPPETASDQIERTRTLGEYKPSTLIDFQAGRPLEIEAIWGEPLRRAKAAGASTPHLEELYAELKQLDQIHRREFAAMPSTS
ncbi:MAG: 2-dehydropantoate 2-reductase [Verrucomicrobiota bacterium]|nr:2-dehydropantoate 2-reductase [Verrucomicrobiota bacterium]